MFYVQRGSVPRQRHTQHRAPDGSLYAEELFGVEGFTGRSSLLYHLVPPTQTHRIEPVGPVSLERADDEWHHHRLIKTAELKPRGHVALGRYPLFFNNDVVMGVIRPAESIPKGMFYRNGDADEMLFFHEGSGTFESVFGTLAYASGDYIVIPIGTTWRLTQDPGVDHRLLYLESPTEIVAPRRYLNDYGQLLEHAPYGNRDLHAPEFAEPRSDGGDFVVHVKARGLITAYHFRHHPFDVVGWDGYLFPFRFNIGDFQPITGRVHQPPPVHQTFAARNYVVCSFVPRKFDYHPLAIPAPYNHSNINSDEVIYYVAGNFMSRRGVDISSFTVHPAGIPARTASGHGRGLHRQGRHRGARRDGRHVPPAVVDQGGRRARGPGLSLLLVAAEDAADAARQLAERGPEAFPD